MNSGADALHNGPALPGFKLGEKMQEREPAVTNVWPMKIIPHV